jgi:LuxR family maltose regulon positive regulatory protein
MVMMARSDPDLPLALLRARNEISELNAEDLRFSNSEIETFLERALPFSLSPGAVQLLENKTEGWVAGLRLITLAMLTMGGPQDSQRFIESFSGEHRYVLEYLRNEVLLKQPEHIRSFLLRTCFLDRLCAQLCDSVLGDKGVEAQNLTAIPLSSNMQSPIQFSSSQQILEYLDASNLFLIPLGSSGGQTWYRYHALFAEVLCHESQLSLGEAERLTLIMRGSLWFENHALLEEAIGTSIKAGQFERAAVLIEQFLEKHNINEILTLRRWCDQVPVDILYQHPTVAFHYALAYLFTSDRFSPATLATIEPLLTSAEESWRAQKNTAKLGELLAVRGVIIWWQGNLPQSFDYSRSALELLPPSEVFWRGSAMHNLTFEALLTGDLHIARERIQQAWTLSSAANNIHIVLASMHQLGEINFLQGDLEQASVNFRHVLDKAIGGEEMLDDQSLAWLGLARIAYERMELAEAEKQASLALEISTRRSDGKVQTESTILLARLAHARGQTLRGQAMMEVLLNQVQQESLRREVWAALVRLSLAAGDLKAARRWFESFASNTEELFPAERERADLMAARLELAEGRPDQALKLLKGWQVSVRAQGRILSEIEILCSEALAYFRQSKLSQATQALAAALQIAQPRGLRQVFLNEGGEMPALLRVAIPGFQSRSMAVFAADLLQEMTLEGSQKDDQTPGQIVLVEPLSARELRVLRLLSVGNSNPEIARELFVSVNTVKTQVRSIYQKLNVNTREEARDAARELGLV